MGVPMRIKLEELKTKGGLEEALSMLQPGDSAVFRFNVDTIFAKSFRAPVPPFMKKAGNTMTMFVKADKLQSEQEAMADQQKMMEEQQKKMMAYAEEQIKKDDVILQDYIKKNNLKAEKSPSGIYYVVNKAGTGAKPKQGQTVAVNYKGMLLDGKVFDSSDKQGKPIEFPIGRRSGDSGLGSGYCPAQRRQPGYPAHSFYAGLRPAWRRRRHSGRRRAPLRRGAG